jgi:agmatinase
MPSKTIDHAFTAKSLTGAATDPTHAGALSFMRRKYTKSLRGADARRLGHPLRRRRLQPARRALRPAGDPPRLGDHGQRPAISLRARPVRKPRGDRLWRLPARLRQSPEDPGTIEREAAKILKSGAFLVTLGGDHYVTWPLLKAHAAKHGKLALIQFDAHQDTWFDDGKRIDHGSFVIRAVRDDVIDPAHSIQIGIRTHAPEDCGIAMLHGHQIDEMARPPSPTRSGARRRHALLHHLRHRLPRPGLCARHRHAGRRRPVIGEDAVGLRQLGDLDIKGADIVEVAPAYDHADITAIAGAAVAQHYLGLLAEKRARR